MSSTRAKGVRFCIWGRFSMTVSIISLIFDLSSPGKNERHPRYCYLHISSCREKNNVFLIAQNTVGVFKGCSAGTRHVEVADLGHWDRACVSLSTQYRNGWSP